MGQSIVRHEKLKLQILNHEKIETTKHYSGIEKFVLRCQKKLPNGILFEMSFKSGGATHFFSKSSTLGQKGSIVGE